MSSVIVRDRCTYFENILSCRVSGLEYALRLDTAAALGVPISSVIVDLLVSPSVGQTQVSCSRARYNTYVIYSIIMVLFPISTRLVAPRPFVAVSVI